MKWFGGAIIAVMVFLAVAFLANASGWSRYSAETTILAHRGLAQTYDEDGLERDTCTATRIWPPEHGFLENTIASMDAAFAAGADVVEFDIHPTTDGQFAVFHDWGLECRTNGEGVTRQQSMTYLKSLDIGYGYTADGGATFPFRGKFVGAMPTLDEVLTRFPDKRFLINIKSRDPREGALLAARLKQLPVEQQQRLMSYGGDAPEIALSRALPEMRTMGKQQTKRCLTNYVAWGWTGAIPKDCRNSLILVPQNYAGLLWGWPDRFVERMHSVGTDVYMIGPYERGDSGSTGIDTAELAKRVPKNFPGGVWTNRADTMVAHIRER
jgi:glycerophosphoryl diester phosphodiesterase